MLSKIAAKFWVSGTDVYDLGCSHYWPHARAAPERDGAVPGHLERDGVLSQCHGMDLGTDW